jgi:TonB family protein
MRRFIQTTTVLAGLVAIASLAHAQATAEQLSRCAAIRTSTARLQCYDTLAKQKPAAPSGPVSGAASGSGRIGNWTVSRETDPISDQKGVTFALKAEGANLIDTPVLLIRCKRGELDVYVAPDEYLGDGNDEVTLRFGTDAPVEEHWTESSDHTALFHPGERPEIEAFVRHLARYDRVAFQVEPYEKAPMVMVFRLAGIVQVSQELRATCPPAADHPENRDSAEAAPRLSIGTGIVRSSNPVYMESVVDERPEVVSGPQLEYPDLLRQASIRGRVLVQAIIDTTGRAEPPSITIIQSPNPGFDQSARNYVLGALFRPARVHGRAVRVLINLPIDFKIRR